MFDEPNAAYDCDATVTFNKGAAKNLAFRHLPS
jgi:hypothetical protein